MHLSAAQQETLGIDGTHSVALRSAQPWQQRDKTADAAKHFGINPLVLFRVDVRKAPPIKKLGPP